MRHKIRSCRMQAGTALLLAILFVLVSVLWAGANQALPAKEVQKREKHVAELLADLPRITKSMKQGINTDADSGRSFFTGYSWQTLFDWDQYFEAIIQLHVGWKPDFIINGVKIFLDAQQKDGFICRLKAIKPQKGVYEEEASEMAKPFLAQSAVLVARSNGGDLSWLDENYYSRMRKYIVYWLFNMTRDNTGLSYWMSGAHTGMDTQHERAGHWRDAFSDGVDLNSYLYRECSAFSEIARVKGKLDDAIYFSHQAEKKRRVILKLMWDEKDGFFYDIDNRTGKKIRVKSVSGFAPMWAGIATTKQVERLVHDHLTNPKEFWRTFPVSAYAATEPGYSETPLPGDVGGEWRAETWIAANYYIFHGLRRYGYRAKATVLANITYEMVERIGDWEYYTSDTCQGAGLHPFWGWSLLAHFMPWEDKTGIDPTDLTLGARLKIDVTSSL